MSGTPTETGGFELNATATNAQGSSTVRFLVNSVENIEAPVLEAGSVDEVGGTTVDLTGKLISSGGTLCNISLYYGTADQNETTGAWEYSLALGTLGQGDIPASLSTLDSGKTYYYRFKGGNPTESWSDVGTFTTLPYDQGILRIHTGMDDGGFGAGWFWDNGNGNGEQKIFEPILTQSLYFAPDGSSWTLTKAIFDFNESLNIGQNLERVILEGVNALSIQVKGNLTIGHSLNASLFSSTPHLEGGSLSDGYDGYYPDSAINGSLLARGNLGGYGGGQGPGKGLSSGRIYKGGASGGGGSFGGEGGPGASGASGILYGSAGLEYLIGGSGGGLGNIGEAGAGGGALELNASGKILIDQGVRISLRGGTVFVNPQVGANFSGGAGSGGALKLIGASIENRGVLDLQGGDAPGVDPREPGVRYLRNAGGAGGGGRIAMLSDGEIITGTTLTEGGQGNSDGAPGLPGTLYTGRLHSDTVQSLEFSSGTLVFDTSGTWKHSAGSTGKGVIQASSILVDGRPYGYSVCEFSFSNLSIGPDVSVVVKGRNSLRLIVDGNATIGTDIRLDGKSGKSEIYSGIPGPGGWSSGRALSDADLPGISNIALSGMGPGGGKGIDDITPISSGGSHGGYGSAGQNNGSVGHLYGDSNITHLVGGSGGGRSAGRYADAGGGGGALSLIVANTFILEGNATLSANGGKGISKSIGSGSGGAGGSIRIEAQHLLNLGRIETLGGDANASGGPGGGGRITLITDGSLNEGNISVSGGTNPDLASNLQGGTGVYSKIVAPVLPNILTQNFSYSNILSPVNIGLSSGLNYEFSGLPTGLKIEDLNLIGTPEQAGTFQVVVIASNRFGETNDTFEINITPGTPSINTLPSSQVGGTSALLNSEVLETGGENATVSFIYGLDAGSLGSNSSTTLANSAGQKSILLTGLENNQTYYFQARISNSQSSNTGSDIYSFTTLNTEVSPVVRIGPIDELTDSNATLHYELVSYDTIAPTLTIFWGPVDQGELSGLWESSYEIGEVSEIGLNSHRISDRIPGETIFFRVRAKTPNNTSWSELAGSGRTVGLPNIEALPAIDQETSSATLRGQVVSTGGEVTRVALTNPKVADGLLAHWSFDEGQGIEIRDSSGNQEPGLILGGVSWKPSHSEDFGTSISLLGEELSYAELPTFQLGGEMTISGWFKLRSFGENLRALDFSDEGDNNGIILSTDGNGNDANWGVFTGDGTELGWRSSALSGDADSKISSDYNYDLAINLHGTNQTVNGVTFTGTTSTFGSGWELTHGFDAHVGSSDSNVQGNIGAMLDQGFKYGGTPQKIKLTGLTDGQAYVFSLFSQAWGGTRTCTLRCSDLNGSITVNQDQYDGQSPDGLVVECTYIAAGSEAIITIEPLATATWHLYAFSNRESEFVPEISSTQVDSLWKLNEWQHIAVSVADDGLTKFYSDGEFVNSFNGKAPQPLTRSYHILGGNRLWMDQFGPENLNGLKLWLDASDGSTLYQDFNGTQFASTGDRIGRWKDKSGLGYDGIIFEESADRTPTFEANSFKGTLPAVVFDGTNDLMVVKDSRIDFDAWDEMTLITVHDRTNNNSWTTHIAKGHRSDTTHGWDITLRNPANGAATVFFKDINGGGSLDMWNYDHWDAALFYLSFGKESRLVRLNGSQINFSGSGARFANASNIPVSIGGKLRSTGTSAAQYAPVMFSEIIILQDTPDSQEMEKIEGYLAHKWSLESKLPSSHKYKPSPPVTPPPDFQLFDGLIDDLRIYNRALPLEEIGQIHSGDLSENQIIGGQNPKISLYWGDEDGESNPETNSSSDSAWDYKIELGEKSIGEFSHTLTGLEFGNSYYYRFLAENDAGATWSPSSEKFSSGSFSLAADTWTDLDLLLWLDASDVNGDGDFDNEPYAGAVDIWRDKSGGKRHASNGQGPELIYGAQNGRSILQFNGQGHYLRISDYDDESPKDLDIGNEATFFFVLQAESLGTGAPLLSKGWSNNSGWLFGKSLQNSPILGLRGTSSIDETSAPTTWPDAFNLFTFRKTDDRRTLRINGTISFDVLDSGSATSSLSRDLIFGAIDQDGINKFSEFEAAEFLLYDQGLANERLQEVEGYLVHKWGLSDFLPLAHPYSQVPPQFENRPKILLPDPFYLNHGENQDYYIPTNRSFSKIEAIGLPDGLAIEQTTGHLTGSTSTRGSSPVNLITTNQAGSYSQVFDFVVTDYDAWPYELELNISGYSGSEILENFPLYLELNESIDGFNYHQFTDSIKGGDLRFLSNSRSTELAYETVKWDTKGTSAFWILIPRLDNNTTIFAKWGNPAHTTPPIYTKDGTVWADYRAVWRMDEDTTSIIRDSASGYHAEPKGFESLHTEGVIGKAIQLDGVNDFIDLPDSGYFTSGTKQASLSFWSFNQNDSLADFTLIHASSSLGAHMQIRLPGNDGAFHWLTGSGSLDDASLAVTGINNQWTHWVFQVDLLSEKSKVFRDGTLVLTQNGISKPFGASAGSFRIGSTQSNEQWWTGKIDEVRLSNYLESAGRISTSFSNQQPGSTSFATPGTVVGPPFFFPNQTGQGFADENFSYLVQTYPVDVSYSAVGLPAGLSINSTTGEISGQPVKGGNYTVTVIAENSSGKTISTLVLKINESNNFAQELLISCENYSGTETLLNFPLKVELNSSIEGFSLRLFSSLNGYDLRFFDSSGTELAYEIETFDISNNRLVAWVKVPELSSATTFTAYWGNENLSQYPADYSINGEVWSQGYRGVWHLRPVESSPSLTDSTSYRNHLSDPNGRNYNESLIGSGRTFFGEPDEQLLAPNTDSLLNLDSSNYSFSSWIRLERSTEERVNDAIFVLGYDKTPTSSIFDDPEVFTALEPTGSAVLKTGPNDNGLLFSSVEDLHALNLGVIRSSGFLTGMLTRFTPPEDGKYEFRALTGNSDWFSLWLDLNRDGNFSSGERICQTDLKTSGPQQLLANTSYNLMLAHGSPTGSTSSSLDFQTRSEDGGWSSWTTVDPQDPGQYKYYHLTFDGNLSDRISPFTFYQYGATERMDMQDLAPAQVHRLSGSPSKNEGNATLATGQWSHLSSQIDQVNGLQEVFLNGNSIARKSFNSNQSPGPLSGASWSFGASTVPFSIDEIRLSAEIRSPDWIQASYRNQAGTFNFPTLGSVTGENAFTSASEYIINAETYFEKMITATGNPVAFLATGLPGGITIDPTDGNLSGTPVRAGIYQAEIQAIYLDYSVATQMVSLNVQPGYPQVLLNNVISNDTSSLTIEYEVNATGG